MTLVARLKTGFPRALRHYLPSFLNVNKINSHQALLNKADILDLRFRISSPLLRPKNNFDTASQQSGDSRSVHRGYGCDYEESRLYQAGDESRYINWPLSARTGQLYMKVFREERRPGVFILLDRRSSMRFGTRTRLKVTQAARAAVCVALNANMNHASIGGVILEVELASPRWIEDSGAQHASEQFIRAACTACPPETRRRPLSNGWSNRLSNGLSNGLSSGSSNGSSFTFSKVLDMLNANLVQGSSIYLISDFIDLNEQHRPRLMQLGSKHKVQALHIFDPSEQQLSDIGTAQFQTSIQHESVTVDTHDRNIKSVFEQATESHFEMRKTLFTTLNIAYKRISTTHESIENILG